MCKYKLLKKPNHWKIMLFLENKKIILDLQEKGTNSLLKIKNRFTVLELSQELNMAQTHVRKYLKELEDLGFVDICKFKGHIEVIL